MLVLALLGAAVGIWQTIAGGPETRCSKGSPYSFFVRMGDPSKLVIELEGGGCCFNAITCALPEYLSADHVSL